MKTTRRNAIASSLKAAVASVAIAPGKLLASDVPGPLPPFPTADMPPDEVLRRLIAWEGGTRDAILAVLASVDGCGAFDDCTEEQYEHVQALCNMLDERIREEWPRDPDYDHDAAVADAARRYGYDHLGNAKIERRRREGAERRAERLARVAAGPDPATQLNAMIASLTREFVDIWQGPVLGGAELVGRLVAAVLDEYRTWDEVSPEELAGHEARLTAIRDRAAKLADDDAPAEDLAEAVA